MFIHHKNCFLWRKRIKASHRKKKEERKRRFWICKNSTVRCLWCETVLCGKTFFIENMFLILNASRMFSSSYRGHQKCLKYTITTTPKGMWLKDFEENIEIIPSNRPTNQPTDSENIISILFLNKVTFTEMLTF